MAADVGEAPLRRAIGGGIDGNERLTGATGTALIIVLAAVGVTILRMRSLTSVHLFLGLALIPLVALKMMSTGYRFARYYTHERTYRDRGRPPSYLRLIAPIVIVSMIGVLASGVALLIVGPHATGELRLLHKASFIIWIGFTAIHVLAHLPDLQRTFLTRREGHVQYNSLAAGAAGRAISLASAMTAGVVLAIVLIPHFSAWSHFEAFRHRH